MDRLTTEKEVSEMNMIELAYNSCYAKDNNARYRDYDTDIDARVLAMQLLKKFADIPNEFTCDEDFDDFMLDSLQYGTESILGVIAVFYRNLWAMADLRERLKEYEEIGTIKEYRKAMEKQRAKKPKINRADIDTIYMTCPSCKLTTVLYNKMKPDYCPRCGQAIDWSVRE